MVDNMKTFELYGYKAEKSNFGGFHVCLSWDYESEDWIYFSNRKSFKNYLIINKLYEGL